MTKLIAATVLALALLAAPAFAVTPLTATQITSPSSPAFVTIDHDTPQSLHVAGTADANTAVDIRCYYGDTSAVLATGVQVSGGAFQTDIPLDDVTEAALGYEGRPYCTLRAVAATTTPIAPPGAPSNWQGPEIGWGVAKHYFGDLGVSDYWVGIAQSGAFNDYDSAGSCGLCDTYLFAPGTKAKSNGIWWANSGLFMPRAFDNRMAVKVDGVNTYDASTTSVGISRFNVNLTDNAGFPSVLESHTIDPLTGDLTIKEHSPNAACAPQAATFPPTEASCESFADSGVLLEREIRQTDNGLRVTIADHWKSVDGQPHSLDAVYEDTVHAANAMSAGHEARLDFTWTADGFSRYDAGQIPLPDGAPATILAKTDRSVTETGDEKNPFGAVVLGSRPSEIRIFDRVGDLAYKTNRWDTRYERSIPAGGEVVITVAYVADFSLDVVKAKASAVEAELTPPAQPPSSDPDTPADAGAPAGPVPQTPMVVEQPTPPALATCVVPKLRGKTLAKAKRLLSKAHCRLGRVARAASNNVKPGRVVRTRFRVGSRHPAGARVRVTVARKARRV